MRYCVQSNKNRFVFKPKKKYECKGGEGKKSRYVKKSRFQSRFHIQCEMRCSLWVTVSHLLNVIWSFSNVLQVDYQDILYKVEHHYYPFSKLFLQIFDHHHLKFILNCTTFSILLFMAFDRDLLCELICRLIAGYEKWLMLRIRDLFRILNSTAESIELHHHLFTTF